MKLSQHFTVTAQFYKGKEFDGRRSLEIKSKSKNPTCPDLIVVMMNPGSSKPTITYTNDIPVQAKPDMTQYKIMRLMLNCDYGYAKVINLSDIIEKDSSLFYKRIKELSGKSVPHSIFDDSRSEELNALINLPLPVVAAWGVEECLKELAKKALEELKNRPIFGIKKPDCPFGYFHPLVRNKGNWPQLLSEEINRRTFNT